MKIYLTLLILIFFACKKSEVKTIPTHNGGVIADDPKSIAKVPLIISSEYATRVSKKDTDKDGIPDALDQCINQKEIFNGYLDSDGCPDTIPVIVPPPPPPSIDTDSDGIFDNVDQCKNEPETFNGFEDTDGCPDSVPIVIPPTPLPTGHILTMPPVQNQGGEGSCSPFAIAYAARSVNQFYKTNATSYSYSSNIFSPEYVYNQTKTSDCGSGAGVTTCLDFLVANGVCTWSTMPYSSFNGCSLMPTAQQTSEAANYKINSYSRLISADITAIKTMLFTNHAIIITVATDQEFWDAGPGFIWKQHLSPTSISHAIVICGYDDSKHAYKIMNSAGTQWGDQGFAWIDYDFFPQTSFYYSYIID